MWRCGLLLDLWLELWRQCRFCLHTVLRPFLLDLAVAEEHIFGVVVMNDWSGTPLAVVFPAQRVTVS
jgi:hypothetical protein